MLGSRWVVGVCRLRVAALAVAAFAAAVALCATQARAAAPGSADLPEWLDLSAEYRVRSLYVDPLDLAGTRVRDTVFTEQRLRMAFALKVGDFLRIHTRFDVLDGVLFGDNGQIGTDPEPITGVSLATKRPNVTSYTIGLVPGADPLDPDSYGPVLTPASVLEFDHVYADVILPVGILRIGRQPMAYGATLGGHDGERRNRWGVSWYADSADRFLFGTKIDEAVKMLVQGDGYVPDGSLDRGVFLGVFVDLFDQGSLLGGGDELRQTGVMLQWKQDRADWFGLDWRNFELFAGAVRLSGDDFETKIWAFPARFQAQVGPLGALFQAVMIRGESREVSEGFAVLSRRPSSLQQIRMMGAQAIVDWRVGPVTLTFEADYASGDADPRPENVLTVYSFPRDLNVGLLLFEHILAFQSARSAAVGIENLRNLNARSFPLTEVATEGRFTNAIALFPQVKIDLLDRRDHKLHTRFGALFAWPDAGVVDPVMTILAEDGRRIDDDAVNFVGGDPGSYYGTELDLQIEWTFRDHFVWTLEGAVLFPGDSLQDLDGNAITSFYLENRFVFLF